MSNLCASSGGRQTHQKTILDLTSNPRMTSNEMHVGRIISHEIVKVVAIQNVLKLTWVRYGKFWISELEDRVMMFEFKNGDDKNQIFDMSSWSIQGHCLSLQRWERNVELTSVYFTKIQFWVQIHDLGLDKFSIESARRIGDNIGEYVETNEEVENLSKSYLRLKVIEDSEKPPYVWLLVEKLTRRRDMGKH